MEDECKKACKLCGDASASAPRPEAVIGPATVVLTKNLLELEKKLKPADQASADPDSLKVWTASCQLAALPTGLMLCCPKRVATFMQASKEPPIIPENVVKTATAVEAHLKEAAQSPITVAQSPMKAVPSPIAVAQSPVAVVQVPDVVRPDSHAQFLDQISNPECLF